MTAQPDMDHHDYSAHISAKKSCSREVLESDCIRAFLDDVGAGWYQDLCNKISAKLASL